MSVSGRLIPMRRSVALVSAFALLLLSAAAGSLGLAEIYRRDAVLISDAWDRAEAGGTPGLVVAPGATLSVAGQPAVTVRCADPA